MPGNMGLIGFNNEPIVSLVSRSMPSVDQPAFGMGKIAARIFIDFIATINKRIEL